ncbi:MAG: DUF5693 family protein [Candidatus Margulisiibacteriota bacterium]|nr:DUF5693 family protein [Candidatus Margulisiibacteriota bacterium]
MLRNTGKGLLIFILTIGVLLGAFLGYARYFGELQDRTVELCVDLNDLKKMAAYEGRALGPILDQVQERGISSIAVFEETLPDANSLGEIYYASGPGVMRVKLNPLYCQLGKKGLIDNQRTYIYAPLDEARKRINDQLKLILGYNNVNYFKGNILEANEYEEEIRDIGLGISGLQKKFLYKKGFRIIPRVWNDPRYNNRNIRQKLAALKEFDTIIFDGEEILGYPDHLKITADALRENKVRYGYIEIVKQDGDRALKKMMDREVLRVHSVPKEELKKLKRAAVIKRFVRAARERKVRLIYLRPFLPPQVEAYPVAYNLDYFSMLKSELERAGFVLGKAELTSQFRVAGWQIVVLGAAIVVGALFLVNYFITVHILLMLLAVALAICGMVVLGGAGYVTLVQKSLALLAAITFPSLAVVSNFDFVKKPEFSVWKAVLMIINILAETLIGVFLLIGVLADYRFTLGVETFTGVKIALLLPIMIVAAYFILKQGKGNLKERIRSFLDIDVKMAALLGGLFAAGALLVFVARSGNFVLPVPGFEKSFRDLLETILFIRPRTKEFMVGWPFLFLAATMLMRGKTKWLWVVAAIGTIAPISVINTFSHIHTPIIVSMIRTINGLALGILFGSIVAFIANKVIKK